MGRGRDVDDMTELVTRLLNRRSEEAVASLLTMQLARLPGIHPRPLTSTSKILYAFDWLLSTKEENADFTIAKSIKIPISTVRNVLNKYRPSWKDGQPPRRDFSFTDLKEFE